eukprot:PITA_03242
MDFVGPINPPSNQKSYIIVCTDYLTKWAETKSIKAATKEKVVEFLRNNIFYKFGYPRELVTDQGSQFTSNLIKDLLTHHRIKHKTSTPYHPQENGQVEVTNKALEDILTKVVSSSRKDLVDCLVKATWAYNTTWKTTTGFTPYELVYGKKALLSIEFEYNTLRLASQLDLDLNHAQQERLLQLNGLDEQRMQALLHSELNEGIPDQLAHHGLIKLLVEDALHTYTIPISWEIFINMSRNDNIRTLVENITPSSSEKGEQTEEMEKNNDEGTQGIQAEGITEEAQEEQKEISRIVEPKTEEKQ